MIELLLTKGRWPFLVCLALVTLGFGIFASRVEVEENNESMNSFSPEERAFYQDFRRTFGDDEDLLVSLNHPDLLGAESILLMDELEQRLEAVDGVRRVYSLANAVEIVHGRDGAEERPLVPRPLDAASLGKTVAERIDRNPELEGFLISSDGRTAGMLVEIEDRPEDSSFRHGIIDALEGLRSEVARRGGELHFTGIAAQKAQVTRLLERDQGVLIPASVVVLGLVLLAFFRSSAGVALPLAVTGVTLVITLGCYQLSGLELNTMTSLLPPVLMVLSIMTSVHLYDHWLHQRGRTAGGNEAIAATIRYLRFPCAFTSLTTALGMLSLTLSDTPAVRSFGAFSALGVMISLGISLSLIPVLLSLLPLAAHRDAPSNPRLAWILQAVEGLATRHPARVVGVALILSAAGIAGITRIENNTDLVRFLKSDNPLYIDTLYIDEHLAGTSSFEFELSRRDGAPLTSVDSVSRLEAFRESLLEHSEIAGVQSVLDVLSTIHRGETGEPGRQLPSDSEELLYVFDLLEAAGDEDLIRRLIDSELKRTRIRVQVHSVGTVVAGALVNEILSEADELLGPDHELRITGSYYQVVRDSNRLVMSQLQSFSLALGLIMATIGLMFRSAELMLLSIIPNLGPVIWTGGLMGALGIDLSTGTAMIASVVIGLAVDDTIHYLTRFRREESRGTREAIHRATTRTGRALVISSVVLVVGFWVGALGSFKPTIYFSLFTGLAMITALVCDLLVLPATLVLLDRHSKGEPNP